MAATRHVVAGIAGAVVLLSAAVSGGMARAQDAGAATKAQHAGAATTAQDAGGGSTACGLSQRITQRGSGDQWVISRPNPFDTSGQQLCISGSTRHPGFTILNNLKYTGAWQAYPFTGVGCAYNLCSPGTDLPMQVRDLPASTNSSFSWTGSAPGSWNASYDIWFDHHDQITAQDDGAELMIWLRPNPGYSGGVKVHISKQWYWFQHWKTCQSAARRMGVTPPRVSPADQTGICWNYVQFRFINPVHGVQRLWIMPFVRYMEQQGLARPSWWLTSIHAGYELVSGGKGLTTTWFSADVPGGTTTQWNTRQASQAAAQGNGAVDVLYKSADATLGHQWYNPRLGWRGPVSMGSEAVDGEPSVVTSIPGTVDAFWEGADGGLWHQYVTAGHKWSSQHAMNLGTLGGPPKAVAQPDGTEDVFWRGTDNQLWYATFVPGTGWSAAQALGGDLASDPAPVASSPGTVDVFWEGTDGNLWHVYQTPGHNWSAPANLNVGTLGGPPAATGQLSGAEDVFWHGASDDHLWHTYYTTHGGWHSANDLGGDLESSTAPVAPVTSVPGTVDVFWEGTNGGLWHAYTTPGHGWHTATSLKMGPMGSMPFATSQPDGAEDVFWHGASDDHLWHAYYRLGHGWHGPQDLGGDLYSMP
jgi:Glycosyl hydrolase family 12